MLETTIQGAKGVLINITGGPSLGLHEVTEAANVVHDAVDEDANVIFGAVIDENMKEVIKVTVIATGFSQDNVKSDEKFDIKKKRQDENEVKNEVEDTKNAKNEKRDETPDFDIPTFLRKKR